MHLKYSWMTIADKESGKPLFRSTDKTLQAHITTETDYKYAEVMFNNGMAPSVLRSGSLACENVNSFFRTANFGRNIYGLFTLYARCTQLFLAVNLQRIRYWQDKMDEVYVLYFFLISFNYLSDAFCTQEFPEIVESLLTFRKDLLFGRYLVSSAPIYQFDLKINKEEYVRRKVNEDGLRFRHEFDGWSIASDAKLRLFICKQPEDWKVNVKALKKMNRTLFNNSYKLDTILAKCMEYGCLYEHSEAMLQPSSSDEDIDLLNDI